jgi:hypothetical protein
VSRAVNKYTVKWYNGSTLLETDSNVAYGSTPDYNGSTPTKSSTAQYSYTFNGWATSDGATSGTAEGSLGTVTGNVNYYAAYSNTVRKYTVTWKSQDGNTTLETDTNVSYGTKAIYNGTNPTKASTAQYSYTFAG